MDIALDGLYSETWSGYGILGVDGPNPFQSLYNERSDPRLKLKFTARALAVFFYPQRSEFDTAFMTYRVQPPGG